MVDISTLLSESGRGSLMTVGPRVRSYFRGLELARVADESVGIPSRDILRPRVTEISPGQYRVTANPDDARFAPDGYVVGSVRTSGEEVESFEIDGLPLEAHCKPFRSMDGAPWSAWVVQAWPGAQLQVVFANTNAEDWMEETPLSMSRPKSVRANSVEIDTALGPLRETLGLLDLKTPDGVEIWTGSLLSHVRVRPAIVNSLTFTVEDDETHFVPAAVDGDSMDLLGEDADPDGGFSTVLSMSRNSRFRYPNRSDDQMPWQLMTRFCIDVAGWDRPEPLLDHYLGRVSAAAQIGFSLIEPGEIGYQLEADGKSAEVVSPGGLLTMFGVAQLAGELQRYFIEEPDLSVTLTALG